MMTSTPSPLFSKLEATPESRPLCQKPPSPMIATARLDDIGFTPAAEARLMPYPSRVLPCEKGSNDPKQWQPTSIETCGRPMSCATSFIAENTGRSGQPVQNDGGRIGSVPSSSAAFSLVLCTALSQEKPAAVLRCGACSARNLVRPRTSDSTL